MTPQELRGIIDGIPVTQTAFARQLSVDRRTLTSWLQGKYPVTPQVANHINLLMAELRRKGVK